MATIESIAIQREALIRRITEASEEVSGQLGVEPISQEFQYVVRSAHDAGVSFNDYLSRVASWIESLHIAVAELPEPEAPDYSALTKAELTAIAEETGLTVTNSMTKADIIELLG